MEDGVANIMGCTNQPLQLTVPHRVSPRATPRDTTLLFTALQLLRERASVRARFQGTRTLCVWPGNVPKIGSRTVISNPEGILGD